MTNFWTRHNQQTLDQSRHVDRMNRISAHYPAETNCTAPDCGWDSYSQSAKRLDCPVCQGQGKVTTWQIYYLRARANWTGLTQFSFFNPTPGVELGDVVLTVGAFDVDVARRVLDTERAYLIVDDKTVRPVTIQKLDVPTIGEEFQIVCKLHTPVSDR